MSLLRHGNIFKQMFRGRGIQLQASKTRSQKIGYCWWQTACTSIKPYQKKDGRRVDESLHQRSTKVTGGQKYIPLLEKGKAIQDHRNWSLTPLLLLCFMSGRGITPPILLISTVLICGSKRYVVWKVQFLFTLTKYASFPFAKVTGHLYIK